MRFQRIAFMAEVPSPRVESFARSNWATAFHADDFLIDREGDSVRIVHRESGRTMLYPWANVAGAEPLLPPPMPVSALVSDKSRDAEKKKGTSR